MLEQESENIVRMHHSHNTQIIVGRVACLGASLLGKESGPVSTAMPHILSWILSHVKHLYSFSSSFSD